MTHAQVEAWFHPLPRPTLRNAVVARTRDRPTLPRPSAGIPARAVGPVRWGPLLVLASAAILAVAAPAAADAGGPDGFGYTYRDSAEPAGPVFDFQDISSSGTPLDLSDDDVSDGLPMGFPFEFYGATYEDVHVSSNGFITFTPETTFDGFERSGCCSGEPLPDSSCCSAPDGMVAAYWEDLDPRETGQIDHQTLGSAPNRVFVVQFTNIQHFHQSASVTFQIKLFEHSNVIEVHYKDVDNPMETPSAGIERPDASTGLQYRFGHWEAEEVAVRYATEEVLLHEGVQAQEDEAPREGSVTIRNETRHGERLVCVEAALDGGAGRDLACVNEAFLGPADPLVPRETVDVDLGAVPRRASLEVAAVYDPEPSRMAPFASVAGQNLWGPAPPGNLPGFAQDGQRDALRVGFVAKADGSVLAHQVVEVPYLGQAVASGHRTAGPGP